MDERLTQEQRELVKENLTVIDCVIRSCVHANNNICGMEYDDLYQIGAIGLCKAASRYKQSKQAAFSTYAFHVVKNTIIDYLRGLNTRLRVQSCFLEESERYIKQQYMTDLAGTLYERELLRALQQSKENCSGSVRKGIEAIELKMQGYSGRDIAERYQETGYYPHVTRRKRGLVCITAAAGVYLQQNRRCHRQTQVLARK